MTIPSNLYAEKIFGEHPLALWALDEKVDYVSLISEEQRDMSSVFWGIVGGEASEVSPDNRPFTNSIANKITGNAPVNGIGQVVCTSTNLITFEELNQDLNSFNISTYLYSTTTFITSLELGYKYYDDVTSEYVEVLYKSSISDLATWKFRSQTFTIPEGITGDIRLVFKINYVSSGNPTTVYDFYLNGITFGQWSEEFNATSTGVEPQITDLWGKAVPAYAYGQQVTDSKSTGFYIANGASASVRNFGIPMVFGAYNVSSLIPRIASSNLNNQPQEPSLVLPGFGFMNKSGQYNDLTLEFWLRLGAMSYEPRKIVGPTASEDGLYLTGQLLSLKVNDSVASYFLGELGRPMLVDIRLVNNSASVLINGEQVISMILDTDTLVFPNTLDSSGANQDWIGFYSYTEITPVQIDCVAIYPYGVPEVVAKRRFVYGQGVDFPENINSSYSSSSAYVDYRFAGYANNYNYPDFGKWERGVVDNLYIENNTLSVAKYKLPNVVCQDKTFAEWESSLSDAQDGGDGIIRLIDTDGYIFFNGLNIIDKTVSALYGEFEIEQNIYSDQTLFKIVDESRNAYLSCTVLESGQVSYDVSFGGVSTNILTTEDDVSGTKFVAGIHIDTISRKLGKNIASIFGKRDALKLYIAGGADFNNTFAGMIHKFSFLSNQDISRIGGVSGFFDSDGIAILDSELAGYPVSYSLVFRKIINSYKLDISSYGAWNDYIPLSYFSKYVKNPQGQNYYSFDFIQFNIDYSEPNTYDNAVYNTADENFRMFITFQSLESKANKPRSYFTNTVDANRNGVVQPDADWNIVKKTRYEVVNGMIIYPPTGVDLSKLSISVHFEFYTDAIINKPIKIKRMQLSSQAFNNTSANAVNTRFGVPMYPYSKLGVYFDYKRKNPFSIYKGSTPYLYLTNHSGIRLRGDHQTSLSRGISIPINQSLAGTYNVGAIQFMARFHEELFPSTPEEVFEIESGNSFIKFYLVATDSSRNRGKIYGVNTSTGMVETGMGFFINGYPAKEIILSLHEWTTVGIQFSTKLSFPNITGAFRITGQLTMNTISNYQFTAFQESQERRSRKWVAVLNTDIGDQNWEEVLATYSWEDLLFIIVTSVSNIDPSEIYRAYTGTNKFIISEYGTGTKSLKLNNYTYRFYNNISWQSQTLKAL